MKTIKEFTFGRLNCKVPAGSPCHLGKEADPDGTVPIFVNPDVFPPSSIERHDATYYGVRVDPANVED